MSEQEEFSVAIKTHDYKKIEQLINSPNINPSLNDNIYLREASRNGSVKIVILLLQDKRIDPSADDNLAISIAGMFGNDDIVDVFYKNYLVNSSLKKNNPRLYGLLKNRFIKNKIGGF